VIENDRIHYFVLQVIQQQPQQQVNLAGTQGGSGLTLIQTASGQLLLQQTQPVQTTDPAPANQIVLNNNNQQRVNYGNIQGIQFAGGIQIGSAVAAQPVVLQQQAVVPSNRSVVLQTLPVVSAANSAAANVIQIGQLAASGSVTHRTHVASPNPPSHSSSNQTEQSGVLVQIGGQTYRMQGVQSVQVANAVRPTEQVQAQQQRHIASATPTPQLRQITPITPSQPSAVTRHLTPSTPTQSGQTITITPSQLALLKQTPPEKQLGMIQLFQRQMAQRCAATTPASNSAVVTPMKAVQIVASSNSLQRTPLSTPTARLSAPTIIRAGPPIAVRVGQNPSSSTAGNAQSIGLQVLRPKPAAETSAVHSGILG